MAKGRFTGGGSRAGRPNKATADIKAIAQVYGPEAIERLWVLAAGAESDAAKVAALKEILDRGYGKATQLLASDPENPLPDGVNLRQILHDEIDAILGTASDASVSKQVGPLH